MLDAKNIVARALVAAAVAALLGCGSSPTPKPRAPSNANTAPAVPAATEPDKDQLAVLETTAGRIVIEFLPQYAPRHTLAFQNMFRAGFFDGTRFHRVIVKRAIQGGAPNSKDDNPYDDGLVEESQRRIPAEDSTRIRHARGTVSAARSPGEPDSATSQFFICVSSQPAWDGQYTIFARVVEGMDVVDQIATAPLRTDDSRLRERPVDPVTVTKGYLAPRATALKR